MMEKMTDNIFITNWVETMSKNIVKITANKCKASDLLFLPSSFGITNHTNRLEDGSFSLVKPVPDSIFDCNKPQKLKQDSRIV